MHGQTVRSPARSMPTHPGRSSSVGPSSTSTVALPSTTTNSSSASRSVETPGVCCQTPQWTRPPCAALIAHVSRGRPAPRPSSGAMGLRASRSRAPPLRDHSTGSSAHQTARPGRSSTRRGRRTAGTQVSRRRCAGSAGTVVPPQPLRSNARARARRCSDPAPRRRVYGSCMARTYHLRRTTPVRTRAQRSELSRRHEHAARGPAGEPRAGAGARRGAASGRTGPRPRGRSTGRAPRRPRRSPQRRQRGPAAGERCPARRGARGRHRHPLVPCAEGRFPSGGMPPVGPVHPAALIADFSRAHPGVAITVREDDAFGCSASSATASWTS
jgi:hypothetical protein